MRLPPLYLSDADIQNNFTAGRSHQERPFPHAYRQAGMTNLARIPDALPSAASALLAWQVHRRAGLRVTASAAVADPGARRDAGRGCWAAASFARAALSFARLLFAPMLGVETQVPSVCRWSTGTGSPCLSSCTTRGSGTAANGAASFVPPQRKGKCGMRTSADYGLPRAQR